MGLVDSRPNVWLPIDEVSGNRDTIEAEHGRIHSPYYYR